MAEPGTWRRHAPPIALSTAMFAMCLCGLAAWFVASNNAAYAAPAAAPDLTISISVNPAVPDTGVEATIEFVVRNAGNAAATKDTVVYLYIDPPAQPPTFETPGRLFQFPPLGEGRSASGTRSHTFTTEGCNHIIYAWVDRDGAIDESDETNNLIALPVCVGVECAVDEYEVDNLCADAGWLTENAPQARSFCNAADTNAADPDWIKFTAFAGVTYTVGTGNPGVNAQPAVSIFGACGGAPISGPANPALAFAPASSGVYYAQLTNAATPGPLSAYSLTLQSEVGVTDAFEDDDRCADARELPTDGTRQTRLFQQPADEDWVRFNVAAGDSFTLLSDNTGQGVNPLIELYLGCNQQPLNLGVVRTGRAVSASATTDRIYFARVKNSDPNRFGAGAHYDLRAVVSDCVADSSEEDDGAGQARPLTLGAPAVAHNFCPAADEDWVRLELAAEQTYVLRTTNLDFAADTVLELYAADGVTKLAENDDYNYVSASRIVFEPAESGVFLGRVRHVNQAASGPSTQYEVVLETGFCNPDDQEGASGDNGPGDALVAPTDGSLLGYNFCGDPARGDLGDQDWLRIDAAAAGIYTIQATQQGLNADPVLALFGPDGRTLLQAEDDAGEGRSAGLVFTATQAAPHFVRVTQFNPNVNGALTDYQVRIVGQVPPTPTPTPSPTPTMPPTPTPTATPDVTGVETLIVYNHARMAALYDPGRAAALRTRLFALADHPNVHGAVIEVQNNPAVAAAYGAWTANAASQQDNDLANAVAGAVRGQIMSFVQSASNIKYIVIVGDDRAIPFRRVPDRVSVNGPSAASTEPNYADDVVENGTVRAALAANMVLTDDYYGDKEPQQWKDRQNNFHDLFLPDLAVGRLIETPEEIGAFIDNFLAGDTAITTNRVLVTGYDFVQDSAATIRDLYANDTLVVDGQLIGPAWTGAALRAKYLAAAPRIDVFAVNGHATHLAAGVPNKDDILATEITTATTDLSGALVYNMGCHGGLNDPGVLDLPQAFNRRLANYVGNTGFGWGGSGTVFSEALMRNYTRELLRDTAATIGPALTLAKKKYFGLTNSFNAFDAKVLMQTTLYGLPMVQIGSGGTFSDDDGFPSAESSLQPPTAFGPLATGGAGYRLPNSFGAFGAESTSQGQVFDLDGRVDFSAGDPVQPQYYARVAAPTAGSLRGAIFLGGVYTEVTAADPVVALAANEYITDTREPAFGAGEFFPATPFTVRSGWEAPGVPDTVLMSLGQFSGDETQGVLRIFDQMSFATFYSNSPDVEPPAVLFVDAVLEPGVGRGRLKVATRDPVGVHRVVVAFDPGQGVWQSTDLAFEGSAQKWTGTITGTVGTRFFVQVVDNAGVVAVDDNKGRYYRLAQPLPLITGRPVASAASLYLPLVGR